jgi:hypothetical protein
MIDKKAILIHALITVVIMAGMAYASQESEVIKETTQSESGGGFFGWLRNDLLPKLMKWPF